MTHLFNITIKSCRHNIKALKTLLKIQFLFLALKRAVFRVEYFENQYFVWPPAASLTALIRLGIDSTNLMKNCRFSDNCLWADWSASHRSSSLLITGLTVLTICFNIPPTFSQGFKSGDNLLNKKSIKKSKNLNINQFKHTADVGKRSLHSSQYFHWSNS